MLTAQFNETELLLAKTMEYLSIPSVVGHEELFTDHLEHDFKSLGLTVNRHLGLLEVSGKTPHAAIVCAHIDRHGLIGIGNGDFAYAAQYVRRNKYDEPNVHSKVEMERIIDRFENEDVYAYDSDGARVGHGKITQCRKCDDTGSAIFHVAGMEDVDVETPLAYARTARITGHYLKGQIDNAISIGALYALFQNGFQGTALLTTEEEIGKSWLHIANYLNVKDLATQDLLVIDTSPFSGDIDPIKEGYVVLRTRDFRSEFNAELLKKFKERCRALEIPFIIKDAYLQSLGRTTDQLGATELGRLIEHAKGRWSGSTIQIPTFAYHTSKETTSKIAMQNYYALLHSILIDDPFDFRYEVKNQ